MKNAKLERSRRVRRRRFLTDEVHHIYQRTVNRFNIFYDVEDHLVYFTIFAIAVRQYGVKVLGLCQMFDHIHILLKTDSRIKMSEFIRQVTSMFAREQNNEVGRKGALFQARFGSAPKTGLKALRTAIAYLFNNPVERKLCSKAEDYNWNFLAYAVSDHPFSEPIVISRASRFLRSALKEVKAAESESRHLRYGQLKRMFGKLDRKERQQLTDYVISIYNPIEYDELIRCYGTYENMLIAINSNTGSEYDIKEDRFRFSDMEYVRMIEVMREIVGIKDVRKITTMTIDEKLYLYKVLRQHLNCDIVAIGKFLHLNMVNE